jgi:hypothetical protein
MQRLRCNSCRKTFHFSHRPVQFFDKKAEINQVLLLMLCSGVSQRRTALFLGLRRHTIARKIAKYGKQCGRWHQAWLQQVNFGKTLIFDEMESFEHTKCKPVSIALAVENKTRRIIGVHVAQMSAKGLLAGIARKRYGHRADLRAEGLRKLMQDMKKAQPHPELIMSDQAPRYPKIVQTHFPGVKHKQFKGRRGCVVGQGELKAGGFDPLFSLNHTAAMIRDNLKRLSRRTWCTTKRADQLQNLLNIYAVFHNRRLSAKGTNFLPIFSRSTIMGAS